MNKRSIKFFMAFFLMPMIQYAYGYNFEVDGIYYDIISSSELTARVTYQSKTAGYTSNYSGRVEIPSTVEYGDLKFNVIEIGEHAFYYCKSLTSVVIPPSIKSIGHYAFSGCSNLFSLSIPNSVSSLGVQALVNSGLRQLTIEDGNSSISIPCHRDDSYYYYSPFYGTSLVEIYIGRDVQTDYYSVVKYGFKSCKKVTIGKYVTDLKTMANVVNFSESEQLLCYAVRPLKNKIYGKNKRIMVPSSNVEAYIREWSPSNNEFILPIVDVMFFSKTTNSEYQTKLGRMLKVPWQKEDCLTEDGADTIQKEWYVRNTM